MESLVAVFGNLANVYPAVSVSESIMNILVCVLDVLYLVYIDDIHIVDTTRALAYAGELVHSYLLLVGWVVSDEKAECHLIQRCLVSLGVAYNLDPPEMRLLIYPMMLRLLSVVVSIYLWKRLYSMAVWCMMILFWPRGFADMLQSIRA